MDEKRIAVVMATTGRNQSWLDLAISSIKANERPNIKIDIFLHFDGCPTRITEADYITCSNLSIGLGDSMNKCFQCILQQETKYDYIARMDDDDTVSYDKFEKQVTLMLENLTVDFCSTLCQIIDENGKMLNASWDYAKDNGQSIEQKFLSGGCHIVHAATMFRADMLYDKGHLWYNPLFRQAEDYDLWFRLIKLGYQYKLVPEYLYQYRTHYKQETRNNGAKKEKVYSAIYGFYKQNWGDFLC